MHFLHFLLLNAGIFNRVWLVSAHSVDPSDDLIFTRKHSSILIIGAGSAGSILAHSLKSSNYKITIVDKSNIVGGRAHHIVLPNNLTVEVGASLIASKNKLLSDLVDFYNLSRSDPIISTGFGIFDGSEYRFKSSSSSYLDGIKFGYRYGVTSKYYADKYAKEAALRFCEIYNSTTFTSIQEILETLNLTALTRISTFDYFKNLGFNENFIKEVVGGIVRATYGQDVTTIHAFAGLVSYYSGMGETYSLKHGNSNLYKVLIDHSNANLLLNKQVDLVSKIQVGYQVLFNDTTSVLYDIVVIACPIVYHFNIAQHQFKRSKSNPEHFLCNCSHDNCNWDIKSIILQGEFNKRNSFFNINTTRFNSSILFILNKTKVVK